MEGPPNQGMYPKSTARWVRLGGFRVGTWAQSHQLARYTHPGPVPTGLPAASVGGILRRTEPCEWPGLRVPASGAGAGRCGLQGAEEAVAESLIRAGITVAAPRASTRGPAARPAPLPLILVRTGLINS